MARKAEETTERKAEEFVKARRCELCVHWRVGPREPGVQSKGIRGYALCGLIDDGPLFAWWHGCQEFDDGKAA